MTFYVYITVDLWIATNLLCKFSQWRFKIIMDSTGNEFRVTKTKLSSFRNPCEYLFLVTFLNIRLIQRVYCKIYIMRKLFTLLLYLLCIAGIAFVVVYKKDWVQRNVINRIEGMYYVFFNIQVMKLIHTCQQFIKDMFLLCWQCFNEISL